MTLARPFRILGIQQVALGGLDKADMLHLWVDLLGLESRGDYRSEKENVDETILVTGKAPFDVEVDVMQPIDPEGRPRVHQPALNHLGLWVDDLKLAVGWLEDQGVRFTPGGHPQGRSRPRRVFHPPEGERRSSTEWSWGADRARAGPARGDHRLRRIAVAGFVGLWKAAGRCRHVVVFTRRSNPTRPGRLKVSDLHEVYYEVSGNPDGKPAIFVHGGPGGGTDPKQRRFFDPAAYRIVLFDQRGCGRSTPHANLEDNTTWHLVDDMERLREHLGVDRWQVFGGSWGSTLALAYAEKHPERVTELVLRGIFMLRKKELHWFYQEGASALFPDAWEHYLAPIPEAERGDLMSAYYKRLTSDDAATRLAAARAWSIWEASTSFLRQKPDYMKHAGEEEFSLAFARIECHYFVNGGFFEREEQLIEDVGRIADIPAVIVQGRYDVVCPMMSAWDLHRAWPQADLRVVPDAGHSAYEAGIVHELVEATDRFRG